jgi:hypothetical protein
MAGQAMTRRRLLTAMLLAPPALVACAPARSAQGSAPDPLSALATAARADAALAAAVIAATPNLAGRVAPLRDARTEHAVALEAEVSREAGPTATAAPTPVASPSPAPSPATLAALRTAVAAAGDAAAKVAMAADAHRVGLVASVAACCTTYAAVLG